MSYHPLYHQSIFARSFSTMLVISLTRFNKLFFTSVTVRCHYFCSLINLFYSFQIYFNLFISVRVVHRIVFLFIYISLRLSPHMKLILHHIRSDGGVRGVMVKAMNCGIVVSEFVLQSRYYVHLWANTLGKGMNPLILPAIGEIVPLLFF